MEVCSVILLLVMIGPISADPATSADSAGQSLFDGKNFEGWEGGHGFFRVEDGAIVGGTLKKPISHNAFLCTKKEYGDFELRVRFKLVGKGANAGIQLRSQRVPNHHEVSGYQADMGGIFWGCLYDESRRNKVLVAPKDKKALEAVLKKDDWNEYRIRCEGPRIQFWINDVQTVDYTETDSKIPRHGIIGLQIHGGGPSEAWYKDIVLTPLAE